jgi:hypothetical protein
MAELAIFSHLIARERAARSAPPEITIWDDGDAQARIDAMRASGLIGARTQVRLIQWLPPIDDDMAPGGLSGGTTSSAAARVAALRHAGADDV